MKTTIKIMYAMSVACECGQTVAIIRDSKREALRVLKAELKHKDWKFSNKNDDVACIYCRTDI